jgi:predicted TIM-barrel fold metal-dependent hydrolase
VGRVSRLNWHIQTNTEPKIIAALKQDFATLPVPVVFDHFGGANAARGVSDPGFDALLELVRAGAYVKISATNLFASDPPQYAGYAAMARALIAASGSARAGQGGDRSAAVARYRRRRNHESAAGLGARPRGP